MLKPRPTLNDDWIEDAQIEVHIQASETFYSHPRDWICSLDLDESNHFMDIYKTRTNKMCHEYETEYEYAEVLSHTEEVIKDRLSEEGLYNITPNEDQIEHVNSALCQAAYDLCYYYGLSWHEFFVKKGLMPLSRNLTQEPRFEQVNQ